MAELDLMLGKPPKLAAAQQGQNQSLTSSRLPPQSSRRCSAFNLQEASFPWQQCFRGIFGTLPPEGPCAHDAHAATSALAPGPGCRQARSPSHCQAGDELPAQRGLGENLGCLLGAAPAVGGGGRWGKAFPERDEGCSEATQPMGWLGLVAMATVVRQSREGGVLAYKGCRAPPPPLQGWLVQGLGQAGNLGRTNSRCWGQFILFGDPWA